MNIRHPLAAVLGVAGIVVGSIAAIGGPATAAGDDLTGTTVFTCTSEAAPDKPFTWNGTLTLTATRPTADSSVVTVVAKVSEMAGVVPVPLGDQPVTDELKLDLAGTAVTLTGAGTASIDANTPFDLPDLQGTLSSSAPNLEVTVASLRFVLTDFGSTTNCAPASGAGLGSLTIVEGAAPTPSPTPTTTTSATATPTPSASPTDTPTAGKPATGSVTFDCVLNPLNSPFDYPATISVAGYREKAGDDVSLSATMSDLPGISPVQIDGLMDVTLDLVVGGEKTTLEGDTHAVAAPKEKVPVPSLEGSVAADGDELDVKVTAFTFEFAALSIDADCTADSVALSTMTVGSEPLDDDSDAPTVPPVAGGTLPQTGGGDSLPVVALWALALTLLGAAGLLCVPQTLRKH